MNTLKFGVGSLAIFVVLCAVFFWAYGTIILYDSVIPLYNYPKDKWVYDYAWSGIVSAMGGYVCSWIWYKIGCSFNGHGAITAKYWIFFFAAMALGFCSLSFLTPAAASGTGMSTAFVVLVAPLGYYLSSIFVPADSVKFVPPLGDLIH